MPWHQRSSSFCAADSEQEDVIDNDVEKEGCLEADEEDEARTGS